MDDGDEESSTRPPPSKRPHTSPTSIEDLPPELLLMIMEKMGPLDLNRHVASQPVCHLWHHLANDPAMWRTFKHDRVTTARDDTTDDRKLVVKVLSEERKSHDQVDNETVCILLRAERECRSINTSVLGKRAIDACINGADIVLRKVLRAPDAPRIRYNDRRDAICRAIMRGDSVCTKLVHEWWEGNPTNKHQTCLVQHLPDFLKVPIYIAACRGHVEVVETLADIHAAKGCCKPTTLMCAQFGQKLLAAIVETSSNAPDKASRMLDAVGRGGWLSIDVDLLVSIIRTGNEEATRVLLTHKLASSAVNQQTRYQHQESPTPLIAALDEQEEGIAELLLEAGADPNLRAENDSEIAPLHMAVLRNLPYSAALLLDRDADINARAHIADGIDCTPLQLAEHLGYKHMARILTRHPRSTRRDTT